MTDYVIYLHGFASSPGSTKANWLKEALQPYDVHYLIPDLNAPDFSHLTLTGALVQAAEAIESSAAGAVHLIGSSMGGMVALHTIDRYPAARERVSSLLCLAPGFDLSARWDDLVPAEAMQRWRATGWLPFFNHATQKEEPLHYKFYEDAESHDSSQVQFDQPMLIIHGQHDETVPPQVSTVFAQGRDNVTVKLVDSDHTLTDQLDFIRDEAIRFFALKLRN
ncbi:MAG: alpha/beta fold hydrolase [Chloroflexi bacterium]|nr:alpha/beta fold hydrolase [Chloroflexota bacterium]